MIDPPSMHHSNNKSARINDVFVTETITDLMKAGCIVKVPFRPYVVSPLSVATNSGNKKTFDSRPKRSESLCQERKG